MKKHSGKTTPRYLVGVGLIVFAVLLFLNNIGIPFLRSIFHHWPIALVIIGVALLVLESKRGSGGRSGKTLPYLLIGVGALFLAVRVFGFNIGALIVPLILVFLGIHILRPGRHSIGFRSRKQIEPPADSRGTADDTPPGAASSDETRIDVFALLGGGDYSTRSHNLAGGSVTALFGGAEVDIRDADTRDDAIEIDILALFGGVELKVPPHWEVTVKALPILGGVTNKTTCLAERMQVRKKQLVVTGTVLFGGLEIRN